MGADATSLSEVTMQPPHEIDYDALATSYVNALHDTLRLFRPRPEFLQTWVLDEDLVTSIAGIFAAAEESGISQLRVRVSEKLALTLDRARLVAQTRGLAELHVHELAPGLVIEASICSGGSAALPAATMPAAPRTAARAHVASSPGPHTSAQEHRDELGAHYAAGVEAVLRNVTRDGALTAAGSELIVSAAHGGMRGQTAVELNAHAAHGGVRVQIAVEPGTHIVRRAVHAGAADREQLALLEALCQVLEGRTVQDNADHAALRTEQMLRGRSGRRPVAGVVMPENASRALLPVVALAHALRAEYAKLAGIDAVRNTFRQQASERWRYATYPERKTLLATLTRAWCQREGLAEDAVQPLEVIDDFRVVFELTTGADRRRAQLKLIALEAFLKDQVEPVLELCLVELKDRNKLRKLEIRTPKSASREAE